MLHLPLGEWSKDVSVFHLEKSERRFINSSQIFQVFSCGVGYNCVRGIPAFDVRLNRVVRHLKL